MVCQCLETMTLSITMVLLDIKSQVDTMRSGIKVLSYFIVGYDSEKESRFQEYVGSDAQYINVQNVSNRKNYQ